MTVARFCVILPGTKLPRADKQWFPRWIRRYASSCGETGGFLSVSERQVVEFLRSLRDHGTPAWQRLQAVRAIEAYETLVLGSDAAELRRIHLALSRLAEQDKKSGAAYASSGARDERHLVGLIDSSEPPVIQQVRRELRLRHKALPTERAYVGWLHRFIRHCGDPDLSRYGEPEIKAFLTDLAVRGNVTAGTQNQAKCALLFLYGTVLGRELEFLDVARATKGTLSCEAATVTKIGSACCPGERETCWQPRWSSSGGYMETISAATAEASFCRTPSSASIRRRVTSSAGSGYSRRYNWLAILARERFGVIMCPNSSLAARSSEPCGSPGSQNTRSRIPCGTVLPRTFWKAVPISVPSRTCWGTRT